MSRKKTALATATIRKPRRRLEDLLVTPEQSLLDAMRVIDRNLTKVTFVKDVAGRIIGTLADGDVRRAILRGTRVDSPGTVARAMHKKFKSVAPGVSRAEVLDLMRAWRITQLPVIDAKGKLTGLHLLEELLGTFERPNRALIMAGGRGVRLLPLTETVPKPMLPVAGRPILERLVLHLVGYGIRDIFVAVNYLGDVIEHHFGDGSAHGCRMRYLRETKPLGTGGPVSLLPRDSKHPVIVMNGDLVTQARIDEILDFHDHGGYLATMCVRPYQVEIPFGVAEVRGHRLVGLQEKPTHQMLTNSGIYVLSPAAIHMVPRNVEFAMPQLFEMCLAKKRPIGAHVLRGEWIDVGRHDEFRRARGET
jgi:dTDP-glucose pyrophosphorylase/CBS domain-containing protein